MTQVAAAADASAEGARADRGRLVQLIVAAVLMGAAGVMLVAAGVWALTFNGVMSKELRDLPHPGNLAAEGRRIFYTFAGVGIAIAFGYDTQAAPQEPDDQ